MRGKKKKWPFSEELTSGSSLKVSMKMYTSKGCELRGEFESDSGVCDFVCGGGLANWVFSRTTP